MSIRETLLEIRELIEGYVDVRDGGALGPLPNDAMRAQQLLDQLLATPPQPHPADVLRSTVTECPNCRIPLIPTERVDGLHLTCAWCDFYATEDWAHRQTEKLNPAPGGSRQNT